MKKILIADVKSSITNLLIQFLSNHFTTEIKEDGFESLVWPQRGNFPDLINVDLHLPKLDGMELLEHVKESGYFRYIPIISNSNNSSNWIQYLKLGAVDYTAKPFNPEYLLIQIKKLLL